MPAPKLIVALPVFTTFTFAGVLPATDETVCPMTRVIEGVFCSLNISVLAPILIVPLLLNVCSNTLPPLLPYASISRCGLIVMLSAPVTFSACAVNALVAIMVPAIVIAWSANSLMSDP